MSKLKIFFLSFLMIIGTTIFSFADSENLSVNIPGGYKYFVKVGKTSYIYFNDEPYKDGEYLKFPNSLYLSGSNEMGISTWSAKPSSMISTNSEFLNQNYSVPLYGSDTDSNLPGVAPIVPIQVMEIVKVLSEQLKIILPTGVTILSVLLGVSLVPRLIRSLM